MQFCDMGDMGAAGDMGELLLFWWPAAAVSLPRRRHLAVVLRSESSRRHTATLAAQDRPGAGAELLQEIFGQGERSGKALSATGRAILWKVWGSF